MMGKPPEKLINFEMNDENTDYILFGEQRDGVSNTAVLFLVLVLYPQSEKLPIGL